MTRSPDSLGHVAKKLCQGLNTAKRQRLVAQSNLDLVVEEARALRTKVVVGRPQLTGAHAVWIAMVNRTTDLLKPLMGHSAMRKFTVALELTQTIYKPVGPPDSPLTPGLVHHWLHWDFRAGPQQETLGTILLDVGREVGMDPDFLHGLAKLNASRLGLFVHEGAQDGHILLKELVTGNVRRCLPSTGHQGNAGELWLVRTVEPSTKDSLDWQAITVPVVITSPGVAEWEAYVNAVLGSTGRTSREAALEAFFKHGLSNTFWLEYLERAFTGGTMAAIEVAGLPDAITTELLPKEPGSSEVLDLSNAAQEFIPDIPAGKISAAFMEFIQPLLEQLDPQTASTAFLQEYLLLPQAAWNAAYEDALHGTDTVGLARQEMLAEGSARARETVRVFDFLVARRRTLFAKDPRLITKVTVNRAKKGTLSISVDGAVVPQAVAPHQR